MPGEPAPETNFTIGIDHRRQDDRVVKASFFCEIAMVTRGFETRLQILTSKVLWNVALVQSRPRFYMAPASADI